MRLLVIPSPLCNAYRYSATPDGTNQFINTIIHCTVLESLVIHGGPFLGHRIATLCSQPPVTRPRESPRNIHVRPGQKYTPPHTPDALAFETASTPFQQNAVTAIPSRDTHQQGTIIIWFQSEELLLSRSI